MSCLKIVFEEILIKALENMCKNMFDFKYVILTSLPYFILCFHTNKHFQTEYQEISQHLRRGIIF